MVTIKLKHIAPWKVVLYSVITIGWYGALWPVRRRREIVDNYKQNIPHVSWYLVALLVFLASYTSFVLSVSYSNINSAWPAWVFLLLPAAAISLGIGIWWMLHFARSVAYITEGKVPPRWTIALFVLGGEFLAIVLQPYLNKAKPIEDIAQNPSNNPSRTFVAIVSAVLLLSSAYIAWDINNTVNLIKERKATQELYRGVEV